MALSLFDGFRRDPLFDWALTDSDAPGVMRRSSRGGQGAQLASLGATDIVETDSAHVLHVDVPGVKDEDLHVEVHDGVLTITGERKNEYASKEGASFQRVERSYGSFKRMFRLPPDVEADHVQAEHTGGQLTVTLPKAAPKAAPTPKKIEIKRG
jgi:HSP20 family protein